MLNGKAMLRLLERKKYRLYQFLRMYVNRNLSNLDQPASHDHDISVLVIVSLFEDLDSAIVPTWNYCVASKESCIERRHVVFCTSTKLPTRAHQFLEEVGHIFTLVAFFLCNVHHYRRHHKKAIQWSSKNESPIDLQTNISLVNPS